MYGGRLGSEGQSVQRQGGDPRPRLAVTIGPLVERGSESAADALVRIARQGYAAVQWSGMTPGLRPRDLDGAARRGLAASLRRLELELAGIDLWIPSGHFLDPATIDRAVLAVEQAIDFVAACSPSGQERGIVATRFPSERDLTALTKTGTTTSGLGGGVGAGIAQQVRDAQAHLAGRAEREGIEIADHALERLLSSRLAVGIDPATYLAANQDPTRAILDAGSRLASLRLVDCHRSGLRGPILEPGEARLDVEGYRVTAELAGYARPFIVDTRQWRDPVRGMIDTLERWIGGSLRPTTAGTQGS